jgi:hypothetical protein
MKDSKLITKRYRSGLVVDNTEKLDAEVVERFNDWCTNVIGSSAVRNRLVGIAMGTADGVKVGDSLRALELIASFGSARPMTRSMHASVTADLGNMSTKEMARRALELAKKLGIGSVPGVVKEIGVEVRVEQEDGSGSPEEGSEADASSGEGGGGFRGKGRSAKAYRGGKSSWDVDVRGEDVPID